MFKFHLLAYVFIVGSELDRPVRAEQTSWFLVQQVLICAQIDVVHVSNGLRSLLFLFLSSLSFCLEQSSEHIFYFLYTLIYSLKIY